ncbi:glycosyl hydrolase [Nesterenkonia sp. LB17]|uniref:glycosyl hydrolase n=1 Tax=Nesterenkonia sp. LB17 TaxID=2901230 RepID=UPI00351CFBDB
MPFSSTDARNVLGAAEQVAGMGGVLMLTLEPHKGLGAVTEESIAELTDLLGEVNASEVPVLLRFAHEMNGSWYPWGMAAPGLCAGLPAGRRRRARGDHGHRDDLGPELRRRISLRRRSVRP